jgi:predicted RNase H-like HicB family nuclease
MKRKLTRTIRKRGRWHVAYVKEMPGANTQGRTLAEARGNLDDAIALVIAANLELSRKRSKTTTRRELFQQILL